MRRGAGVANGAAQGGKSRREAAGIAHGRIFGRVSAMGDIVNMRAALPSCVLRNSCLLLD